MVEMMVRTVDRDPKFGSPVAMLLPRDRTACAPLALPIRSAEACSLTHELEGQVTPRTQALALLAQTLTAIGGYVAAITVEPDDGGEPIATVRVCLPDGWSEHRTDPASALGLAVYTMLPLLVSEHLTHAPTDSAAGADASIDDDAPAVPVPFLRALDE